MSAHNEALKVLAVEAQIIQETIKWLRRQKGWLWTFCNKDVPTAQPYFEEYSEVKKLIRSERKRLRQINETIVFLKRGFQTELTLTDLRGHNEGYREGMLYQQYVGHDV